VVPSQVPSSGVLGLDCLVSVLGGHAVFCAYSSPRLSVGNSDLVVVADQGAP
jgi:hypothetical protein